MSRLNSLLLALLLCFTVAPAHAAVELRQEPGLTLELVGEARLKVLFWPIYDSRLYSADGVYQRGQRPLRFEITYLRDVRAVDLVARTEQEWRNMGKAGAPYSDWLQELARIWPDISRDDVLALHIDADNRSLFTLNGEPLGGIEETAFGAQFMDIWLSPETSRPAIRAALTGAANTMP